MITDMTWQIDTTSSSATEQLAKALGRNLKGGEVIELVSDLGGGKTTFVRGLARGICTTNIVSSPTFKISNEYQGKKLKIYHFDFYRLHEPGVITSELAEVTGEPDSVVVMEWAEIVRDVLPENCLTITFSVRGEEARHLHFDYPKSLNYLLKGLV
jgi:tRNA threonylcarbamoyladenosine biosynthesis protein TsaE